MKLKRQNWSMLNSEITHAMCNKFFFLLLSLLVTIIFNLHEFNLYHQLAKKLTEINYKLISN